MIKAPTWRRTVNIFAKLPDVDQVSLLARIIRDDVHMLTQPWVQALIRKHCKLIVKLTNSRSKVMAEHKQASVKDFLTTEQALAMRDIWLTDRRNFHKRVMAEVLEPNMAEINRKLGQENNAAFLAYALEYACGEASKKRGE